MRWPLRRQILLPMVAVMLATIVVVSGLNAWLATRRVERAIQRQLADVVRTLSGTNFPLERTVLKQMHGLTGAEYVISLPAGEVLAASAEPFAGVPASSEAPTSQPLHFERTVVVEHAPYFHAAVPLDRRPVGGEQLVLHSFYPEATWQEARRQAIVPPLLIGGFALLVTTAIAYAIALRVTQPVQQLQQKVQQIAAGDFHPLALGRRNDEIRDLTIAVNRMAALLAKYEEQVRRNERLRTLGQLGGGIAHQVRNAATGCRIALDLHRRDCELTAVSGHEDESLGIAVRQLSLIESHVQRFLTLGRRSSSPPAPVALSSVVQGISPLVQPLADHIGVRLKFAQPPDPWQVQGDAEALQQLLINLLLNGIEAASHARATAARAAPEPAQVTLEIRAREAHIDLLVGDNGAGPAVAMQSRLFEPLATDKPQGTGLGLSVVKQIAEEHGGSARWERRDGWTWFIVELPKLNLPREVES